MKASKTVHEKEMEFKTYLLILKREGKPDEVRELEAYGRDYARRWADNMEIQENCKIVVKTKNQ